MEVQWVGHDYLLMMSALGTGVDSSDTTWVRYFPSPIQILSSGVSKKFHLITAEPYLMSTY